MTYRHKSFDHPTHPATCCRTAPAYRNLRAWPASRRCPLAVTAPVPFLLMPFITRNPLTPASPAHSIAPIRWVVGHSVARFSGGPDSQFVGSGGGGE